MLKPLCSNFSIFTAIFRVSEYLGILQYFLTEIPIFNTYWKKKSAQLQKHFLQTSF